MPPRQQPILRRVSAVEKTQNHKCAVIVYRIAGKFGEEFNLANWQGILKNAKLKIANFDFFDF